MLDQQIYQLTDAQWDEFMSLRSQGPECLPQLWGLMHRIDPRTGEGAADD